MPGNFIRGVGFSQLDQQRWTITSGLSTVVEHTGTYNELVEISRRAQTCGYREASLARAGEGKKVWKLRLTYIGRDPETITGGRAQIELQSNHWLASSRLENLPLWKHPKYADLINPRVVIKERVWHQSMPSSGSFSYIQDRQLVPERVINFDVRYPYSSVLQRCAEAWRNAIGGRYDALFRDIFLKTPPITTDLSTIDTIGFINILEPFDVRRHLVTRVEEGSSYGAGYTDNDLFSILPSDELLVDLAQDFCDNILSRRELQQYNRVVISNDWIVSEFGITGESYEGVDEIWASSDIQSLINSQIERRRERRRGSGAECIEVDATFEEVDRALSGRLKDRVWVKRMPTLRQIGQGRLQLHNEWESKLPIEVNTRVTPPYSRDARLAIRAANPTDITYLSDIFPPNTP